MSHWVIIVIFIRDRWEIRYACVCQSIHYVGYFRINDDNALLNYYPRRIRNDAGAKWLIFRVNRVNSTQRMPPSLYKKIRKMIFAQLPVIVSCLFHINALPFFHLVLTSDGLFDSWYFFIIFLCLKNRFLFLFAWMSAFNGVSITVYCSLFNHKTKHKFFFIIIFDDLLHSYIDIWSIKKQQNKRIRTEKEHITKRYHRLCRHMCMSPLFFFFSFRCTIE